MKPGAAALLWFEPTLPEAVDPLHAMSGTERRLAALIYDHLIEGDRSDVLASWDLGDDGRYHLVLRAGVAWTTGDPVTADDLCFSLAAVVDPHTASPLALRGALDGHRCEPVGSGEVAVWLPVRPLNPQDAFAVPLLPRDAFRSPAVSVGHPAFRRPIGTTAWTATHTPGLWTLTPVDRAGSWRLEIRAGQAPRNGTAGAPRAATGDLAAWREGGVALWSAPTTAPWAVWIDATTGPLARVEVRRALDLLLDRPALRSRVDGEDATRADPPLVLASGPFAPRDGRASRGIPPTRPDPQRADALLAAAGYPRTNGAVPLDGTALTLAVPDGQGLPSQPLGEAIAGQLRSAGLHVDIVPASLTAWASSWRTGIPVADLVVAAPPPLPGGAVAGWFRAGGPAPCADPRVVDALRALDAARDANEVVSAGREAHAALADALPALWLWFDDAWAPIPVTRAVPTPNDLFGRMDLWQR